MKDTVRIGMIGVGQIGTNHLKRYSQIPEAQIVAACDLFPERLEAACSTFGIPDRYSNYADLLARDDIDAVDVCVHNNKHAPLTIAALQAGKHVYCEKPMAGTYCDARRMCETAAACGRKLSIQLGTLFSLETKAAKRLIDEGRLGKLYYARSVGHRRRGRPFVDGYGTANFVHSPISAGGALYDMGVYHIANMLYLLGLPEVETVTGATHQAVAMYEDRRAFADYDVEEMGLGWVRLAGGISFDIEETWAVHHEGGESSKVLGSDGGIRMSPFAFYTSAGDMPMSASFDLAGSNTRWHSCFKETLGYESAQHHWIWALLGRVPLLPTDALALATSLISEGIYLSNRLGREVSVAEIRDRSISTAIDPLTPEKVWA